ncbi:hypothetical protein AB0M36_16770 [Actinoplanes sp. NPDC051346]|uniref:hypothetical protein n=1 Tax=Actinoplanes sp. NPDC051346 TaxID=3155048 RepID=UPI003419A684
MTSMESLDQVLREVARVRVTEGGASEDRVLGEHILLDTADPAALRLLRGALAVEQTTDGHCMCLGDLAFEFFDSSDRRAAVVGFHHGVSLRWPGWDGDALLRDGGQVKSFPTDARIDAGAVRHLCGWKSRPHQARDIGRLPIELRERLLAAAHESGDDDKRHRAQRWLSSPAKPRRR